MTLTAVQHYLAPPSNFFWKWSAAEGPVATWSSGKTIAFLGEITALVTRLAQHRLPPLAAILLFRAACRDDWKSAAVEQGNLAGFFAFADLDPEFRASVLRTHGSAQAITELASQVFARLDSLAALPSEQRKGLPALCDLAEAFFEGCFTPIDSAAAEAIAVELANGIPLEAVEDYPRDDSFESAVAALTALWTGAGVPSSDALTLRKKTGLDAPVKPAEIPVPEAARHLIASLQGDPEFAGLAKLARDLLAAISVPRSLRPAEDLPLGGFSDITNRGALDRLLVTELAHDDLTLAVRVATNEALYMRRETPPAHPPERRALLLDSGLRMWGVPRVFAAAAALAFAAQTDPRATLTVHRAAHALLEPVHLASRQGLTDHLAALATTAHPGDALPAFFKSLEADADTRTEAIIITHEAALADPDFQHRLATADDQPLLVATVARDGMNGRFRLIQITRAGRRVLTEATLPIASLLQESAPPKRPLATDSPHDLPVILSLPTLPLLLPHGFDGQRAIRIDNHGLLMFNGNGRLIAWQNPGRFAREIANDLPAGTLLGLHSAGDRETLYVVVRGPNRHVLATGVNLHTGRATPTMKFISATEELALGCGYLNNVLFVVYPHTVLAMHAPTGNRLAPFPLDHLEWVSGHYFRHGHDLFILSTNGTSVSLERIFVGFEAIDVIDRPRQSPLLLSRDGRVMEQADQADQAWRAIANRPPNAQDVRLAGASPDGARVAVRVRNNLYQVDIARSALLSQWRAITPKILDEIRFGDAAAWPASRALRRQFDSVSVRPDGTITLHTRRRLATVIAPQGDRLTLSETVLAHTATDAFERIPSPARGYELKRARTPFGNIYLDSRGLLHLAPRDRAKPQLTLTLMRGDIAAWASNGLTCGPDAFHPGPPVSTPAEIAAILRDFATPQPPNPEAR